MKSWFEIYQMGLDQIKNVLTNILMRSVNLMKDSVFSLISYEVKLRLGRLIEQVNSFSFQVCVCPLK